MSTTRHALLWSFAERYASLLMSIGSTMLLSRLLTPVQVGIYSMCAAVTAIAGILRDFGITEYLIQEKKLTHDKIRAAFGIAVVIAWSLAFIIFLGRNTLANFYGEPGVAQVLGVLVLHFLLLPISSPAFALLNREMAFKKIFALQLTCNASQSLVSVGLAYLGYGYLALAWGAIANVAVQAVLLMWMRPRQSLVMPGLLEARSVLRFGSMFVSSRVIEVLVRNFHEPVIAKSFDFASVGIFSRAWGLIDLFHTNVTAAVVRVATPAFAAEHRAGRPIADAFARATTIFTSISWPAFSLIALTADEIIRIMFGHQWVQAAPIASMLALTAIPTGLYALAPQMLSATGHVNIRLRIALFVSPVHIACVLGASFVSLTTVAAVWAVSNTFAMVLYLYHLRRVLGMPVRKLLAATKCSIWVTIGSVLTQALTLLACRYFGTPSLVTLSAVTAFGALGWWLTARATKHPAFYEVQRLVTASMVQVGWHSK